MTWLRQNWKQATATVLIVHVLTVGAARAGLVRVGPNGNVRLGGGR